MLDFLDWRLSADEKKAFDGYWEKRHDELLGMFPGILQAKYKVTFSFDEQNMTFICTFTAKEDKDPNIGWAMSSRSPDPYRALGINLYKHFHLCSDGEWPIGDPKYSQDEG